MRADFWGMKLKPMPECTPQSAPEAFREAQQLQRPLVLRRFAADWPAMSWTWSELKHAVGNRTVGVRGSAFANGQSTTFFPKPIKQMPLSAYFAQLERDEASSERLFAFNLRAKAPGLPHRNAQRFKQIGCRVADVPAYFFGARGSETRIHFDFDWVDLLLTHFLGQKRVLLFAQDQSENLYQIPGTVHSAVDFGNLDAVGSRFERLQQLVGYEVLLNPGDTLYIPKGYWHHITYISGSFSVTYRILPRSWSDALRTARTLLTGTLDILINKLPGVAQFQAKRRSAEFKKRYGFPL